MQQRPELCVAVTYVAELVQQNTLASYPPEAVGLFERHLTHGLQQRIEQCWYPDAPDKGNALRAVHWNTVDGHKDLDPTLLQALDSLRSHYPISAPCSADAMELLPYSFTLWIDPDCVSVAVQPNSTNDRFWMEFNGAASEEEHLTVLWHAPSQKKDTIRPRARATRSAFAIAPPTHTDHASLPLLRSEGTETHGHPDDRYVGNSWFSVSLRSTPEPSHITRRSTTFLDMMGDGPAHTSRKRDRCANMRGQANLSRSAPSPRTGVVGDMNYTTHDNGNVIVLGSDVKLGSSSRRSPQARTQRRSWTRS